MAQGSLELLDGKRNAQTGAPAAFALVKGLTVGNFALTARVRCTAPLSNPLRDLSVVFGHQDEGRFYFVHFAASSSARVNMIALVNGGKTTPIHLEKESPARLKDDAYHQVKVERNAATGAIKAYIDDMATPILQAVDKTFPTGGIGFSSLGDKGFFDDVEVRGERADVTVQVAQAAPTPVPRPEARAKAEKPVLPPAEAIAAPEGRVVFRDDFSSGKTDHWMPREGCRWEMATDEGAKNPFFRLAQLGKQFPNLRGPQGYAILQGHTVKSFVLTVKGRCLTKAGAKGRDLILVFGYRDQAHFYYVHFSNTSDGVHNAILKVDGKDRQPLSLLAAPVAKLDDREWHTLRVWRDVPTGFIRAYVDELTTPTLVAKDATFGEGLVGMGAFDDLGDFDDVVLAALE